MLHFCHIQACCGGGCPSLSFITIPGTVSHVGNKAFYACSALISANILNGVTVIGDFAFQKCSILSCLSIPKNLISIGNQAFFEDPSLLAVSVPTEIKYNGVVDAIYNSFSPPTFVTVISPASSYVQAPCN